MIMKLIASCSPSPLILSLSVNSGILPVLRFTDADKKLSKFDVNHLVFVVYLYSSTNRGNNGNVNRLIATHRANDGCHSQALSWQHIK